MNEEEITSRLKEAYKVVTGEDAPDSFTMSSRLRDDMGLSSIGMLYYVIVIESLFSIRFENVGVEDFRTVGDVVGYIKEKTAK